MNFNLALISSPDPIDEAEGIHVLELAAL